MPDSFSGGCRCGQIRYQGSGEPAMVANCHCRDCQHASGGAYSTVLIFPRDGIEMQGEAATFTVTAESGSEVTRGFCATCGSPLFSRLSGMPDVVVLKAGSLDDPSWVKPAMQIWTDSSQPWAETDPELPSFGRNPG